MAGEDFSDVVAANSSTAPPPAAPAPKSGGFDVAGARKAGYSDDEILSHLTATRKFDIAGAEKAGYSKPEIIDHLSSTPAPGPDNSPGAGLKELWEKVPLVSHPIKSLEGMANFVAHPVDAYMQDAGVRQQIWDAAKRHFEKGDYASAAAKALYSMIPFEGAKAAESGDQFARGEYAKGIGSSIGQGLSLAGPAAVGDLNIPMPAKLMEKGAEGLYRNALKPSIATAPTRVAQAVRSGLENEIPISADGVVKLNDFLDKTQQQVSGVIDSTGPNRVISPGKLSKNLDTVADSYKIGGSRSTADPAAAIADTNAVKNGILDQLRPAGVPGGAVRNMTAQEAQAMKVSMGRELRTSYGKASDPYRTAQKDAVYTLKTELNNQFPGVLDELNTKEAGGLNLDPLLERRVAAIANQPAMGVGPALIGAAVHGIGGGAPASVAAGFMWKVLGDPTIKSRIAIGISRASKGAITVPKASTMFGAYLSELGQASADDKTAGQPGDSASR